MTKRHFVAFAKQIKADLTAGVISLSQATYAADLVSMMAQQDNGRFDRDRFLTACGLR